eukprot:c13125_g1_i1 orf=63-290(-)
MACGCWADLPTFSSEPSFLPSLLVFEISISSSTMSSSKAPLIDTRLQPTHAFLLMFGQKHKLEGQKLFILKAGRD